MPMAYSCAPMTCPHPTSAGYGRLVRALLPAKAIDRNRPSGCPVTPPQMPPAPQQIVPTSLSLALSSKKNTHPALGPPALKPCVKLAARTSPSSPWAASLSITLAPASMLVPQASPRFASFRKTKLPKSSAYCAVRRLRFASVVKSATPWTSYEGTSACSGFRSPSRAGKLNLGTRPTAIPRKMSASRSQCAVSISLEPSLVPIPEGWFLMGSDAGQDCERPVHGVWVDAFLLAATQITNAEYALFLRATSTLPPPFWNDANFNHPDQPVTGVSWFHAAQYCESLRTQTDRAY